MGYRDDRDAAYQRAEALATDVARSQAAISERDRHIQLLHAELSAARTRPPTAVELADREEARRQGRRGTVQVITAVVGLVFLLGSALVGAGVFTFVLTVPPERASYEQYVAEQVTGAPATLAFARAADVVTRVGHCVLAVALFVISLGMLAHSRWSAWAGAVWCVVALGGCVASGIVGHALISPYMWLAALPWVIPAIIFSVYTWIRLRYELR